MGAAILHSINWQRKCISSVRRNNKIKKWLVGVLLGTSSNQHFVYSSRGHSTSMTRSVHTFDHQSNENYIYWCNPSNKYFFVLFDCSKFPLYPKIQSEHTNTLKTHIKWRIWPKKHQTAHNSTRENRKQLFCMMTKYVSFFLKGKKQMLLKWRIQ